MTEALIARVAELILEREGPIDAIVALPDNVLHMIIAIAIPLSGLIIGVTASVYTLYRTGRAGLGIPVLALPVALSAIAFGESRLALFVIAVGLLGGLAMDALQRVPCSPPKERAGSKLPQA